MKMKLYIKLLLICLLLMPLYSCKHRSDPEPEPGVQLPVENFGSKGYGIYNYDGAGASVAYLKYQHQLDVVSGSNRKFRLLMPYETKFFEMSSLPSTYTEDGEVTFTLYQNLTKNLSEKSKRTATVYKVEGGTVWLIDSDLVGYVIPE